MGIQSPLLPLWYNARTGSPPERHRVGGWSRQEGSAPSNGASLLPMPHRLSQWNLRQGHTIQMGVENNQPSIQPENYKDIIVTLRVTAEEIPQDIVKAILHNDIDEVVYKVDDIEYLFRLMDVTFVENLN